MRPPSDEKILSTWAIALGLKKDSKEYMEFLDKAAIAQGILPKNISEEEMVELLPAFFRTMRNGKPTKEELDELINLLKKET